MRRVSVRFVACFVMLCSSVVVSVGYSDLFRGLMTLLTFPPSVVMPFGKFHIVAVSCPVVLSCFWGVLFDSFV